METNEKKKNIGYGPKGMLLIIGTLVAMFVVGSASTSGLNLAIPELSELHGWSVAQMYSAVTWVGFVQFAFFILMSFVIKKVTKAGRMIALIGIICAGLGIVMMGWINQYWLYIVSRLLVQCGGGAAVYYGYSILIGNWFPKRRGQVMGIVTVGYNLAALLVNWLLLGMWTRFSVSSGFLVWGIIAVCPLILVLFIKEYPEDCGAYPDNDRNMTPEMVQQFVEEENKINETSPFKVGKLLKSKRMWCVAVSLGLLMMATAMVSMMVSAIMWRGYTQVQATLYFSIAAGIAIPASIIIGFVDTAIGTKKAAMIIAAVSCAGMFFMGTPGSAITLWLGIVCFAFLNGTTNNMMTSLSVYVYGRYDYKSAYAVIYPIMTLVYTPGYMIIAQFADISGGYRLPFYILGGVCAVALLMLFIMKDGMIGRKSIDDVIEV